MKVLETSLPGVLILEPRVYGDARGWFMETFNAEVFREAGLPDTFAQDNHSFSVAGVVRGLHYQLEQPQGKLVRCARGRIFDVAVDLRRGSPTYGRWEGHELDDERHRQLFVPVGFGHGFCVLSETADVHYKLSSLYHPETEAGIAWDDPQIAVEWPLSDPQLSDRDRAAPKLAEVADELPF